MNMWLRVLYVASCVSALRQPMGDAHEGNAVLNGDVCLTNVCPYLLLCFFAN